MRLNDIIDRLSSGQKILSTMPSQPDCAVQYGFEDGQKVSKAQFEKLSERLIPLDPPPDTRLRAAFVGA